MSLEALEQQLRDSSANGRLSLSSATTGIAALDSVLEPIAEDGALEIEAVEIVRDDGKLTLAGNASFLNVTAMPILATFVTVADQIEMSLVGRVRGPWGFAQSFPNLPD